MYGYKKKSDFDFKKTVERTKEELKSEGFGVLTEIDLQETLKNKISVEMDKYTILGACNPPSAYKALKAEKEIGLMLPCNVIVYEQDSDVFVTAIKPGVAMSMIDNPELMAIAANIEKKLKSVIDSI